MYQLTEVSIKNARNIESLKLALVSQEGTTTTVVLRKPFRPTNPTAVAKYITNQETGFGSLDVLHQNGDIRAILKSA